MALEGLRVVRGGVWQDVRREARLCQLAWMRVAALVLGDLRSERFQTWFKEVRSKLCSLLGRDRRVNGQGRGWCRG